MGRRSKITNPANGALLILWIIFWAFVIIFYLAIFSTAFLTLPLLILAWVYFSIRSRGIVPIKNAAALASPHEKKTRNALIRKISKCTCQIEELRAYGDSAGIRRRMRDHRFNESFADGQRLNTEIDELAEEFGSAKETLERLMAEVAGRLRKPVNILSSKFAASFAIIIYLALGSALYVFNPVNISTTVTRIITHPLPDKVDRGLSTGSFPHPLPDTGDHESLADSSPRQLLRDDKLLGASLITSLVSILSFFVVRPMRFRHLKRAIPGIDVFAEQWERDWDEDDDDDDSSTD